MARKKKGGGGGGGGGGGHDGGGSLRWLLTYADMITLLMAFFIMMYSMSVLNLAKFNEVAFSIRSGFGGIMSGGGMKPMKKHNQAGASSHFKKRLATVEEMQQLRKQTEVALKHDKLSKSITIELDERGVVISVVADGVMYDAGSAEMRPAAITLLTEILDLLRPIRNDIAVEGHTCDIPIHTTLYPSNWELSSARACSVVRFFEAHGIPQTELSAVGYGPSRPRFPNDSEAHRAYNRRVDIVILAGPRDEQQPGGEAFPPPPTRPVKSNQGVRPYIPKVWNSKPSTTEGQGGNNG